MILMNKQGIKLEWNKKINTIPSFTSLIKYFVNTLYRQIKKEIANGLPKANNNGPKQRLLNYVKGLEMLKPCS